MKKPELLAPGGSFLSAYHAFQAGADGVYLGMTEFSARKAASNFTFEQLRRIRRLAADQGKRIYVTVNTIVRESEIERLTEMLFRLEALAVDGIIVQDLGVLSILRRDFPRLPVHASTQMAVHNPAGIGFLKRLGVRRVILPRELTLTRIRALREAHPDMELETFIHGAMCYSFSGVCLASSALTGRSGNRGDCAQICRSLFSEAGPKGRRSRLPLGSGHYFSCRDLFLGREVLELSRAGVDAFKIEGRMKSPEYVFNTARLYRELIDRGDELAEDEYEELVRRTELTFSREKTGGFLHAPSGSFLIDVRYPGHRGALLGTVESARNGEVSVTLQSDLSIRDGLAVFGPGEPFIFSVQRIRRARREVKFARKGETVSIDVPPMPAGFPPVKGREIRQLSSRFLDLPQPREASFPLAKMSVDIEVCVKASSSGCSLSIELVGGPAAIVNAALAAGPFTREVTLDAAAEPRDFTVVLARLFSESGDSLFALGRLTLVNRSGRPRDGIFIPPSALKKAKNDFYRHLESLFDAAMAERVLCVSHPRGEPAAGGEGEALDLSEVSAVSRREHLSWRGCEPIPFALLDQGGSPPAGVVPASRDSLIFVPLPPLVDDERRFLDALKSFLARSPQTRFALGLSNVSHIAFAQELEALVNVAFFVDFPLYVANRAAALFLSRHVKKLMFMYFWIEGTADDYAELAAPPRSGPPLVRVSPSFSPPLFTSLGCFAKHVSNGGRCLEDCPRSFSRKLRQGRNRFRLVVRDCVTYLFSS